MVKDVGEGTAPRDESRHSVPGKFQIKGPLSMEGPRSIRVGQHRVGMQGGLKLPFGAKAVDGGGLEPTIRKTSYASGSKERVGMRD